MRIEISYKITADSGWLIKEATIGRTIDYFNSWQSTILNRLDTILDDMEKDKEIGETK